MSPDSSSPPPPLPPPPQSPGLALAKWKWYFDFQMPLVGIGLMVPLGVAWSMLVGAVISWGVLWPVLDAKKGAWYPDALPVWDARGLFGYQLSLAMGLVMADGLYFVAKGCVLGCMEVCGGKRKRGGKRGGRRGGSSGGSKSGAGSAPRRPGGSRASVSSRESAGSKGSRRRWHAEALAALENDALSDASNLQFSMAAMERTLRKHVFMVGGSGGRVNCLPRRLPPTHPPSPPCVHFPPSPTPPPSTLHHPLPSSLTACPGSAPPAW
jgi:hypothetical protein